MIVLMFPWPVFKVSGRRGQARAPEVKKQAQEDTGSARVPTSRGPSSEATPPPPQGTLEGIGKGLEPDPDVWH